MTRLPEPNEDFESFIIKVCPNGFDKMQRLQILKVFNDIKECLELGITFFRMNNKDENI